MKDLADLHRVVGRNGLIRTLEAAVEPLPPSFDGYYDAQRKEYLVQNSGGRWLSHNDSGFKRILRGKGLSAWRREGELLSAAEKVILELQNTRDVSYAGALAGRDAGFYEEGGVRFLVTSSPRLIAPKLGSWSSISALIDGLVGTDPQHGVAQKETLFGWLQVAYDALRARKRQPGQALALAGPIQSGKSLLQTLVTEILGGRSAKAFRYMTGGTPFNSELFGAEHLMLEDEHATSDSRARSQLGASIKSISANEVHSCHAKGREAVNLRPFWRLSISLNDEPERLLVLPTLTEDIADKLILLKCSRPSQPFPTGTHQLKEQYWLRLVAELPAFLAWLTEWERPPELHDERFGVRYFHHPDLVGELQSLSSEARLLELIDAELWRAGATIWEGTAMQLEHELTQQSSDVRQEALKLFSWSSACGAYLGRLADQQSDRIQRKRTGKARKWIIKEAAG